MTDCRVASIRKGGLEAARAPSRIAVEMFNVCSEKLRHPTDDGDILHRGLPRAGFPDAVLAKVRGA